jgi:hypothetical protein
MKRFSFSLAYIDGSRSILYLALGQIVAVALAILLQAVVNPWWLWLSVSTVFIYQLAMYWLMRQFYDYQRSLVVLIFGLVCLGLAVNFVTHVTNIRLPNDLPIVVYLSGFYPYQTDTYDPGSVAVYYASFAHVIALTLLLPLWLLAGEGLWNSESMPRILKNLDLTADFYLDKLSFRLNQSRYSWAGFLLVLSALTITVVVGSASVLL